MLTANQVLKNLANSQENTWVGKKSCFKKETPIQGFPVNFLKLLDKIFFCRTPPVAASVYSSQFTATKTSCYLFLSTG